MGASILLLDDDHAFRALLVPVLAERGHRVSEVSNCASANACLAGDHFDLLIVDGELPDQDGRDWIAAQRSAGNRLPIAFITGRWNDFTTYTRLVNELGVAAVAYKPVVPATFADTLQDVLAKAQPAAAPQAEDLEDELAELRQAYARELPDKVAALAGAVDRLRAAPADGAVLKQAISLAHRLRGTAGSYGFNQISQAGAVLEEALRTWQGAASTDDAALRERIEVPLAAARQAAQGAAAPPVVPASRTQPTTRVLLAEREAAIRAGIREAGLARGLAVVEAATVAEAAAEFQRRKVDAVISALHLGGSYGGLELAAQLRAAAGDVLPLLFLGHGDRAEECAAAIHGGAAALLPAAPAESVVSAALEALSHQRLRQPSLLLVDDDADFAALTLATVEDAGLRATWIDHPAAVQEALARENPDVLLLDVDLPTLSGFDVCRTLRQDPRWQELPILFLTARTDPTSRIAAFECGGDDYIPKPVVAVELRARIRGRLERSRLLRERGDRDALTGLYLRRRFSESLGNCLSHCRRSGEQLALVLLDLDRFKSINDTYGHLMGDRVLAALGRLLGRRFRSEDLRGRWGGEEFMLAFPGLDGQTAGSVVTRALEELRLLPFEHEDGRSFHASFSGGVAVWPQDGDSADELVRCADQRLYQAKAAGRSRVVCATEDKT